METASRTIFQNNLPERKYRTLNDLYQISPINDNSALVEIMACRRTGDKPLSKPMMSYIMQICKKLQVDKS